MDGRRPWLTRNVRTLSGVSLLQDAASELLYPILPLFLTGTLGAPAAVVGAVEGIAEGTAALSKLVVGRLADRYPRRPLIAAGYGLAAVGKLLIALAAVWPVVLAGRAVDRLGEGVRAAPRDALLVAGVEPAARGRVFGFHRAADTAGAVVGPAIGLGLLALLDGRLRPLLWVAVVPAVASVLLVALVREDRPPPRRTSRADVAPPGALPPRLRVLLGLLTIFGLVNLPDALLLLRAHEIGLSTAGVVLVYLLYNVVYALGAYPAGALSDRLPRHRVVGLGLGLFAVTVTGLALATATWQVFALFALYGGYTACTDGVGRAWVSSLAPADRQGGAQGLYAALTGGAVLVAGLWGGALWQGDGRLPLLLAGGAAAVVAVALLGTGRWLAAAG